jgi:uncharacterized membrane protein
MVSQGPSVGRFFRPAHRVDGATSNVSEKERMVSMVGGAALTMFGLKRRSIGGLVIAGIGAGLFYRGMSGRCSLYNSLGISTSRDQAEPSEYFDHGVHVEESVTINKKPAELFAFWRNFENLARFMQNLRSVEVLSDKRSRWVAYGPGNREVEWESEIINEEKDHLIAWRTLSGADIQHTGSVRFIDAGDRGTTVKVAMEYLPPAGRIGLAIAKLFQSAPDQEIRHDLRRFKQLMESGEIPTTRGQPRGGKLHGRPTPADKSRPAELKSSAGAAKDHVQESSEGSFPASDPPGWGSSSAG